MLSTPDIIIICFLAFIAVCLVIDEIVVRATINDMMKRISDMERNEKTLEKNQYDLNRMLIVIENHAKKIDQDVKKVKSTFDKTVAPFVSNEHVIADMKSKISASEVSAAVMQDVIARQQRQLSEYQSSLKDHMQK